MDVGVIKLIMAGTGGLLCILIGGTLCARGVAGASSGEVQAKGVTVKWQLTGPGLGLVALGVALMIVAVDRPMTDTKTITTTTTPLVVASGPAGTGGPNQTNVTTTITQMTTERFVAPMHTKTNPSLIDRVQRLFAPSRPPLEMKHAESP